MTSLPAQPGIYAFQLSLLEARNINVGGLGNWVFPPAEYIYVGSALGPGGLNSRLGRHLRRESKKTHWHIDYLRNTAEVTAICYFTTKNYKITETAHISGLLNPESLECRLLQALTEHPGAHIPIPGFGSSDCRMKCPAHLVAFSHSCKQSPKNKPLLSFGNTRQVLADAAGIPIEQLICKVLHHSQ
jgi:Uri superfamily endonuclease